LTDDRPVYYAPRRHLSRAKLTARSTIDMPKQNFLSPEFGTKFQNKLLLLLLPFNGLFSRTTWVSRYQKGKTNLDFTGARNSEWQWHQMGHMQVRTSLQTDNYASTPPLCFLQAGCPSSRPNNSVKALKAQSSRMKYTYFWRYPNFLISQCRTGRKKPETSLIRPFDRTPDL